MKSEDYITIQGWMVNDLGLKNISHVTVFAIIYSFSRDGVSSFRGSQSYLAKASMLTRTSVNKILKKLEADDLIEKIPSKDPRSNASDYRVCKEILQGVNNLTGGVNNLTTPVKKLNTIIQEDNTSNNTSKTETIVSGGVIPKKSNFKHQEKKEKNSDKKEKKSILFDQDVRGCLTQCLDYFPEHLRPSNVQGWENWADTIEKLHRIDKIPYDVVVRIVQWARNHDFWAKNFLSITKLRKKNPDGIPYVLVFSEAMQDTKKVKLAKSAMKNMEGW